MGIPLVLASLLLWDPRMSSTEAQDSSTRQAEPDADDSGSTSAEGEGSSDLPSEPELDAADSSEPDPPVTVDSEPPTEPPADLDSDPGPSPAPRPAGAATAGSSAEVDPAGEPDVRRIRVPTESSALERSPESVEVVKTDRAAERSADLGEVLARTKGVGVRRGGGLGSATEFSLAGLTGEQIPIFLDGVPIAFTGFGLGISNIPVNMLERVEIYRGVVPIRFGADALGGAVNLVTDRAFYGPRAGVSYQGGSFDTHRVTANLSTRFDESGLYIGVNGLLDSSRNDYLVDVEVPDERGRLEPATVRRFHDGYQAVGGGLEIGVVDRPWAERLILRGFFTAYRKQLQHNVVMTLPYGDVQSSALSPGATLSYAQPLAYGLRLETAVGYGYHDVRFEDVGTCNYDWFGRCVIEGDPGEISTLPSERRVRQHGVFARLGLRWPIADAHTVSLSIAPTGYVRSGREAQTPAGSIDPLSARRDLFNLVIGLDYTVRGFDDRVQNVVFGKDYVQAVFSEEPLITGALVDASQRSHRVGVGDGVRVELASWASLKASYEWATRLPGPDEVFGNALLVIDNLDLAPERSHNVNVGALIDHPDTRAGGVRLQSTFFARVADDLIVLLGNDRSFIYENVFGGRSLGVEGGGGWTSPGRYFSLDANVTYQDFRNTSRQGAFADFRGDRIPNRPWLFANGLARLEFSGVLTERDRLSLDWNTRYVHPFFRGWESVGVVQFKQRVPAQVIHGVGATYGVRVASGAISGTVEVMNLLDAAAFDFFGVQRPGRAVFGKLVVTL
ncbi:MAG: TonB-dependent siderophore myxochelin receptor MxcH [Myxococcota bacterium]